MYHSITKVQTTENYELILLFDNSEKRIFDVKPIFKFGRFSELKDKNIFNDIYISFDTIEWTNGLDLDPEYLYKNSRKVS